MHSVIIGINQCAVLSCQALFYVTIFVTLLECINNALVWFGERVGVENMTAEVYVTNGRWHVSDTVDMYLSIVLYYLICLPY